MRSFGTFAMSVEPWTIKYKPRTSKDVAGNKPAIEKLRDWIDSWSKGRPSKAAVLLYGPAGVGKTSVTEALAQERGWDLVEISASDKRSGDILAKVAGLASTQSTLFSKGRLILLDEVDGINLRADQGAVATILQIIKETQYPLILTANDPWDPKTRPLREDRKSTRLNSSHDQISYAVFCLKKKKNNHPIRPITEHLTPQN